MRKHNVLIVQSHVFACATPPGRLEWRTVKTSPAVRAFQVVVDLDVATSVAQSVLRGILRFAREAGDWSVLATHPGMVAAASPSFAFDGFVAGRGDSRRRFARALRGRKTVELRLDAASVARLAAEHFLARGFAHYAFVGHDQAPPWSAARLAAFRRELAARGLACEAYPGVPAGKRDDLAFRLRHLAAWLAARPRPLAVFAAFDARAREVLDACHAAGLGVPEDVAVLGVDDDPLMCEATLPSLSSVALDGEAAGHAAAAALDAALRGRPGARRRIVLGGVRVEARGSTARFIGRDPLVAKVRALVAARLRDRLPVSELARELGVSHRTVEERFRAETGVPVGEAILRERLARAKDLLRTTALPCEEIAAACGICDASHLAHLFRRRFGAPPSAFRGSAP